MMNIKGKRVIGILSLCLFLSAGLLSTLNMGEQTTTHIESTDQYRNTVNLLTYFQQGFQDKTLPDNCKEVLASSTIDFDVKEYIAIEVSKIFKSDRPMLYFLAIEIGRILGCSVLPLDQGYLIFSGNDLAIFLEHGKSMQYSAETSTIISLLANTFDYVLLASCDSIRFSHKYSNVHGFEGIITLNDILISIGREFHCNELLHITFKSSQLRTFCLWVTPEDFFPTNFWAVSSIMYSSFKNLEQDIPWTYFGSIPLEWGQQITGVGPNFGVAHINHKCEYGGYGDAINNELLRELLTSPSSLAVAYPGAYDAWMCTIFKYKPQNAGNYKVASLSIGINPLYVMNKPAAYLTLLTADVAYLNNPGKNNATQHVLNKAFGSDPDRENEKFGFTCTHALSEAPYTIDQLDSIYDYQLDPSIDSESDKMVTMMLLWLALGWPMALIFDKCNDRLIDWLGEGTFRYYMVWVAIAIAYLIAIALTVALVVLFWECLPFVVPIVFEILRQLVSVSGGLGMASTVEGNDPVGNLLPKAPSYDAPEINISDIDFESDFYDDDNDGIPNTVEYSYFLKHINGTAEEQNYIGQKNTWLNPMDDYDNDGLATITEYIHKSDPYMTDTDDDGLDDNEEIIIEGSSRTISVNLTDYNRDGTIDTQSIYIQGNASTRSSPSHYDTDYDGMSDKMEVDGDLKPFCSDQDFDRMLDGWEVYSCNFGWNYALDGFEENDKYNPEVAPSNPTNWAECDPDGDSVPNYIESYYFTNPYSIDTDEDGLSDRWEIEEDFDPTDSSDGNLDNDQDGLSTGDEVSLYGTYWGLPDSDDDGLTDGEEINVYFTDPQYNDTDEDTLLDGEEINCYDTDPTNSDTDGDQLSDSYEIFNGLDPTSTDSDDDNLSDDDELYIYFTDPTNADPDEDGLNDFDEVLVYFTDPFNSDTDSDGLLDGEEVLAGEDGFITNPLDADTDADGIDDYEEVFIGTDGYVTDPNKWDTDDDFMSDSYEIANNLDPTDDDFDDDGLLDGEELLIYHSDPTKTDTDGDGLNDYTEVFTYNTDPANADSDNDGLSDKEEVLLWGDGYITDPNDADSDNDGLLDGEEYAYGSNPNDSDTDGDYIPDGEEVIPGTDGYETDPTKWDTDGDGMDDFSEINNGLDPTFNDAAVDSDHDDLNNLEEFYLGTDPYDSDSDNDGMKDGWEATYSLNPLSDDAMADADGDGLKNIDEYLYDCNPRDIDSDNDGLNDKLEVVTYGTDPNDSDTDNDGWSDYYEVYTSGTSPTKADTDGDGIADKTEYYWWINTYGQSSTSARSKIKIKDVDNDRLSDGYEKSHNYNPLDSDMDNDGLSDGDEVCTYHTDPKDSDSDNDGYNDLYELVYGTDPNDSSDYPGSGDEDDDDDDGGGGWVP